MNSLYQKMNFKYKKIPAIFSYFKNHSPIFESKIEKVPRGIRGEKSSKDMASSRKRESEGGNSQYNQRKIQ